MTRLEIKIFFSLISAALILSISRNLHAQETHSIERPTLEKIEPSNPTLEKATPPKPSIVKPVQRNLGRPTIGLVLKGGGALGFAHVGVLKVLERNHIPVDVIAGTSMGSIVGAAYASGSTVENMEHVLSTTDWDVLFGEKIHRENVDYRLKAGRAREIYGDTKISSINGKFNTPMGVVEGQNIRTLFQSLFGNPVTPINFDSLPIPFRAVTTDIGTGEVYVPDSGDLVAAVRASMSIPGAFSPIKMDGHVLVDGGLADNLPIDVALQMGADILIVVDLKCDLTKAEELTSALSISGQMVSMLLMQNSAHSLKLVRPQDVVVPPDVNGFAVTDFPMATAIMARGEKAAEDMVPALKQLSISEADYAAYSNKRTKRSEDPVHIDFIRIKNNSTVSNGRIEDLIKAKVGDNFDQQVMADSVQNIYQTGYFKTVQYSVVKEGESSGVEVNADAKDWLGQYLRLGFSVEDNLKDDDGFRLAAAYRTDDISTKDSYFEMQGEVGRTPHFSLELYQPIEEHSYYFVAPKLSVDRNTLDINQDDTTVAEYLRTTRKATLSLGRRISTLGEARVDYTRGIGKLAPNIGDESLEYSHYNIGDLAEVLELDSLDKPDFPTSGYKFNLTYNAAIDSLGAPSDFQELGGLFTKPFTFERQTLILRNSFNTTFGERPYERSSTLGGFLNISGTLQNSLVASDYNSGQLILFRRFSEVQNPFFDIAFFTGASYEISTIHNQNESFDSYNLINSGSVFIGADTPLLPLYFGVGAADIGEKSVYIAMGRLAPASK